MRSVHQLTGPVLGIGGFLAVNAMALIVLLVLAALGLRAAPWGYGRAASTATE